MKNPVRKIALILICICASIAPAYAQSGNVIEIVDWDCVRRANVSHCGLGVGYLRTGVPYERVQEAATCYAALQFEVFVQNGALSNCRKPIWIPDGKAVEDLRATVSALQRSIDAQSQLIADQNAVLLEAIRRLGALK